MTQQGEGTNRPLRVLEVTARYYPDSGGIETHVHEVSRRMRSRSVDAVVLATDRSGKLPRAQAGDGFGIERVRAYPTRRDWYAAPGLWRRVVTGDEDLVHCQGVHTLVPVLAAAAALWARKPFMVTLHTGGHSSPTRSRLRGLQWKLLAPLLRRARLLIGVSAYEAERFREVTGLPHDRVRVIRNGGSLPPLRGGGAPHDPASPLLLSVGRLERYKGHHRLIEALAQVLDSAPGARAEVLGTGPYEGELRALVDRLGLQDRVTIGYVPGSDREEMARRVERADLVVMLSDYEAHPVAVMEALTLGRPVLVTRTSGLTELADAGLVAAVEPDDPPEVVARAIVAQLAAPLTPPADWEIPTWDTCAEQLAQAYRDAVTP